MKVVPLPIASESDRAVFVSALIESISCGFPNPAQGLLDHPLDIGAYLIKRPASTYFARAQGASLKDLCVLDGDTLIIDRALEAKQGSLVVASINGEHMCKILDKDNNCLLSANDEYPPFYFTGELDVILEGVIIHSIHHYDRR